MKKEGVGAEIGVVCNGLINYLYPYQEEMKKVNIVC